MTNLQIEDELKTLIDADNTWTKTKLTYVWIESHAQELDLHHPPLIDDRVTNVIHSATRTLINRTLGSEVYAFIGILFQFANTTATLKSGNDDLKEIADADSNLLFFFPGIKGDPINNYYYSDVLYKWDRHISH